MTDANDELHGLLASAIRQAKIDLSKQFPASELFGFALCTDDDLRTLYHVACTKDWVQTQEEEQDYSDIGYIYVEWSQSGNEEAFDRISEMFSDLADREYASDAAWGEARDNRFEALVLALKDCRDAGVFHEKTLLCAGSTDPSDHLEYLDMNAVDRLNAPEIADKFAAALEYEHHRQKT